MQRKMKQKTNNEPRKQLLIIKFINKCKGK